MSSTKEQRLSVAKKIRMYRAEIDITQVQLASKCGCSTATIIAIEKGNANFSFDTLVNIASALKCDMSILFTPGKKK